VQLIAGGRRLPGAALHRADLGMMTAFSFVSATPSTASERRISRLSLDLIMAWLILWAVQRGLVSVVPSLEPWVQRLGSRWMYVDAIGVLSFAIGLVSLGQMTRRLGRLPDARIVVPWVALYGWYALLRK
jgi:hypothetical protein